MKFKVLLSLLVLCACQKAEWKTLKNSLESPLVCKVASQEKLNSYELQNKKVLNLPEFLKKDFEISILLDRECLQTKTLNELNFLLKDLKKILKPKNFEKYSRHESFTVKLPFDMKLSDLESLVEKEECIKGVTKETYGKVEGVPNDPLLPNQSHLKTIRYAEIYDTVFTSTNRLRGAYVVAVIDTGYQMDHPDLVNQWRTNPDEIPGNNIDDDLNGIVDDVHGANLNMPPGTGDPSSANYAVHGTHVAGLIAAQVNNGEGISSVMGVNAKILPINAWPKFVGISGGAAPMSAVDRSIRYAVDEGAHVINISMQSVELNPNIQDALNYAVARGVTVVVAAGNNSKELGPNHTGVPAYYAKDIAGVVAVAATDSKDGLVGSRCEFSNYSTDYVEIAAPGCDSNIFTDYGAKGILSCVTAIQEASLYGYIQGTSMASPVAAGVAIYTYALLKEKTSYEPTAALVEKILKEGSSINPNLVGLTAGAKQVDMQSIYKHIQTNYTGTTPPPTCP